MRRLLFYICLLLGLMLHTTCVEELDPSSKGYENLLVVEAFLSNSDDNFTVKLSRSNPIDTTAFIPEMGANVELIGQSGEQFRLSETSNGIYESNGPINPVIGNEYKVHIQTRDNKNYESDMVTMRDTPTIDDLSFKYEERPTAGLKGLQMYVSTHDPENNTWFYRWEWEETWMFRVGYKSYLKYEDGQVMYRAENLFTCWKSGESTSIEVSSSKNLALDIINEYPIHYVTSESDRLSVRYSFNVKQYSLSEESYNYWLELQKATENLGTLFDQQPSIIKGNYRNVDAEDEIVLGYFDAAALQEKRVYASSIDLPGNRFRNFYAYCIDSIVPPRQVPEMVRYNWEIVSEEYSDRGDLLYLFTTQQCMDCTLSGTNVKPEFWEY